VILDSLAEMQEVLHTLSACARRYLVAGRTGPKPDAASRRAALRLERPGDEPQQPSRHDERRRRLGSPFSRPPPPALVEIHLAKLAVAGRRAVSTLAAVTRVPVLGPRVAETVAVDVAEVPCLVFQDRLVAPGAVVEAGLNRGC
jgi:hypothetical protein